MTLRPGDTVLHFVIVSAVGAGGMGQVYLARDTRLQRSVALKIMHPLGPEDESGERASSGAARLLREAQAAAALDHPNVVTIFEVGEIEGTSGEDGKSGEGRRPFIAMELVKGKPLRAFIGDGAVSRVEKIRWLADVGRALAAAHRAGLVHRDVKPENVMVRDDGVVKVLDFGLAKRQGPSVASQSSSTEAQVLPSLTGRGVTVGTPYYMAPEQMRREPLDGRADQFAWGVMAYELLSGEPTWGREVDALGLVSKILSEDPAPLGEVCPEVAPHVAAVVMRTLAKRRGARFETMEALLDALLDDSGEREETGPKLELPLPDAPLGPPKMLAVGLGRVSPRVRGILAVAAVLAAAGTVGVGAFEVRARSQRVQGGVVDAGVGERDSKESRMSSHADATESYRAGRQAFRDASLVTAKEEFDHAIDVDPHFAAAHLWRALLGVAGFTAEQRQDLLAARNNRDDLSERDRVLLDASEPTAQEPTDGEEVRLRYEAAVRRYPSSGELQLVLATALGDARLRAAGYDAAIEKDPALAVAWAYKAELVVDPVASMEAYEKCLALAPSATSCLEGLATLEASSGRCEDLERTSRRLATLAPRSTAAHKFLAQALLSTGQPLSAVHEALRQGWEHLARDQRRIELQDEASLATLSGDFEGALRWDEELERELASTPIEGRHFQAAYHEVLVNLETGQNAQAVKRARKYLDQRSAWEISDFAPELTIFFYEALLSAGSVTKKEADAFRMGWLARERARLARIGQGADAQQLLRHWARGEAAFATTPAEATAAIAARPAVPASATSDAADAEECIGSAYLVAGKLEEAQATLSRLDSACMSIDPSDSIFRVWTTFRLGETLEREGNTPGLAKPTGASSIGGDQAGRPEQRSEHAHACSLSPARDERGIATTQTSLERCTQPPPVWETQTLWRLSEVVSLVCVPVRIPLLRGTFLTVSRFRTSDFFCSDPLGFTFDSLMFS